MSNRPWLDDLERELSRRKLPRREVARLAAELSDHLTDMMESLKASGRTPEAATVNGLPSAPLQENHMSMDANVAECLGSPAEIAESALREYYRRQSLLSRSRLAAFCTFILLPLPALILAWVAAIAALAAFGYVLNWFIPDSSTDWKLTPNWAAMTLCFTIAYVVLPAAAITALFGRIARKTAHPWRWGLAACLLVALGTMAVRINVTFSETPGKNATARGKNQVMLGAGFAKRLPEVGQIAQFLLPLATGVFVLRCSADRRSPRALRCRQRMKPPMNTAWPARLDEDVAATTTSIGPQPRSGVRIKPGAAAPGKMASNLEPRRATENANTQRTR